MQISKEEKLAQLETILQSRVFHGSESLRAFLRFVVDKAVEDQHASLKEYVIATEVFGRGNGFDSRVDSVVRVQAGRLRSKLHEYYGDEGKDDMLIIDLPKGQYVPIFSYTTKIPDLAPLVPEVETQADIVASLSATAAAGMAVTVTPATIPVVKLPSELAAEPILPERVSVPTPPLARTGNLRVWQVLAGGLGLLVLVLGIVIFTQRQQLEPSSATLLSSSHGSVEMVNRQEVAPLWGDFLRSSEPVLIVYSNTLFQGNAEEGMKLLKSLDSSGSSNRSPAVSQSGVVADRLSVTEHYTGVGEVMGAYSLGDFLARALRTSRIKRSLLLTWDDLKTENIVVLGSPAENLFLRDLPQEQELTFKAMDDEQGRKSFGVFNTKPQAGEQQRYFAKQDGPSRSQVSEDYAVISLLKGLDQKRQILILAGVTTFGTQAAAEYVTKTDHIRELISRLNTAAPNASPTLPRSFQVLVKVKVNGGVPVQISYVTHHVL